MTEQTPDFWWSPTMGVLRKNHDKYRSFTALGGGSESWWGSCLEQQWPADAVQLAPVGEDPRITKLKWDLDNLKEEIGEVIDAYPRDDMSDRIAAILDSAPAREEARTKPPLPFARAREELTCTCEYQYDEGEVGHHSLCDLGTGGAAIVDRARGAREEAGDA